MKKSTCVISLKLTESSGDYNAKLIVSKDKGYGVSHLMLKIHNERNPI